MESSHILKAYQELDSANLSLSDQLRALALRLDAAMSNDEIADTTLDYDVVSAILVDFANGYSAGEIAEALGLPEE